jgi:hypothetical protein
MWIRSLHRSHRRPPIGKIALPASFGLLALVLVTAVKLFQVGHPRAFVSNHPARANVVPQQVSAQGRSLLYKAEQIELRDCLRARGFKYWLIPKGPPSVYGLFPYVVDSIRWARHHGFGSDLLRASERMAKLDPNARYIHSLRTDRRKLNALGLAENGSGLAGHAAVALPVGGILGHNTDGCVAASQARLYGSFPRWFRAKSFVGVLPSLWQQDVLNDPRYRAAATDWVRCMKGAGQQYSSPAEAAATFLRPGSHRRRASEIKAAVAEAECANSTGLAAVSRRLDNFYSHLVTAKYWRQVIAYRTLALGAIPRARAIIRAAAGAQRPSPRPQPR